VRFLRNHLKRTPNVQLISFFILINTGATLRPVSSRETSLIPFPAQELFVEELGGFDLVIFQDFNYGPFSTRQHLHRVRDYVREGGGMVLVGGRLSFGAGGYVGTELAEVLPIEMTDVSHDEDALDTEEFSPQLTSAGRSHTVTRLSFDPIENERLWETAPSLEGVNKSRGIVQGGVSLLEHPTLRMDDGSPMPVLALSEPGDGRVAAITTDTFWRLKMPAVGQGADGHQYDTFWRNLIRWLIKDPELDLVRVTPSEGVRALGESVTMDVRVFTPDYRPATDHDFSIQIVRRPRPGHETAPETIYESVGLRTDDHGRQSITHDPVEAGIYDVIVRTVVGGRQLTALSVFVIADERPEMRNVMGEGPLMGAIARLTNGQERSLRTRSSAFPLNPPRVSQVISRRYHERWNVPGVFALICLLFTLEWWYRRRAGLI
jgi:uncharacterized membrane protein